MRRNGNLGKCISNLDAAVGHKEGVYVALICDPDGAGVSGLSVVIGVLF